MKVTASGETRDTPPAKRGPGTPAAGTRSARAGSKPDPPGTRLSTDGSWWWNGEEWVPAVSPDGLWSWQGSRWQFALQDLSSPAEVARSLEALADQRYVLAGELLASRPAEWPVPKQLEKEVELANRAILRIGAIDRQLEVLEPQSGGQGLSAVFGRLAGVDDERDRLARERTQLQEKLGAELLAVGRGAPVPSYRAADEYLVPASRLNRLAQEVASANAAVVAARAEQEDRIAAAQRELDAAGAARSRSLQAAEAQLQAAEKGHAEAVAAAWAALAEARMPGRGDEVASFGPLTLHSRWLGSGGGGAPVTEVQAVVAALPELLAGHGEAVDRLFLAAGPGAEELHAAEAEGHERPFLLISGSFSAAVDCEGHEEEAQAFAERLRGLADAEQGGRPDRRRRLARARTCVDGTHADRSGIESAAAGLAAAESDPDLLAGIESARARLEAEQADQSRIEAAVAQLDALIASIATAPAPLRPA